MTLLLFLVTASRIPLLWSGYGSDKDAWQVANAADKLWHTGEYTVSRFPGYPLHEIVSAPLVVLGGAVLSNGMTLTASLVLLLVLLQLAAQVLRHARLLVFTLAFTPLFWINSAATMDYIWSLLFFILSLHGMLQKRIIQSGLWFGIAVGFRLANIVAIVPLISLLKYQEKSTTGVLSFLGSASGMILLAYAPLLLKYGPAGWLNVTREEMSDIHPTWAGRLKFFIYRSIYSLGPIAVLALCSIVVSKRRELKRLLESRNPLLIASIVGVGTFLSLFFFFPLEPAYLLPAIVFLLIIIAAVASRTQLIVFAVCSVSFAFLNPDVIKHQGKIGTPELNIHPGMVIEEIQKRYALLHDRVSIAGLTVSGKAIIMTGGGVPFWFQNEFVESDTSWQWKELKEHVVRKKSNPDMHFVAALQRAEIGKMRSLGYSVYCLDTAEEFITRRTGISMTAEHVSILHR